jgi:hypothetical protein
MMRFLKMKVTFMSMSEEKIHRGAAEVAKGREAKFEEGLFSASLRELCDSAVKIKSCDSRQMI